MFGTSKKDRIRLEARIARIERTLTQLAQPQAPSTGTEVMIAAASESQAKTLGAMGDFIQLVSQIASERAAVALGRRGGQRRAANAKRDKRGRMLPARKRCRLCANPLLGDPSLAELEEHFKHKDAGGQVLEREERIEEAEEIEYRPAPAPARTEELPHVVSQYEAGGAGVYSATGAESDGAGISEN
jgi:hypothetical protein